MIERSQNVNLYRQILINFFHYFVLVVTTKKNERNNFVLTVNERPCQILILVNSVFSLNRLI